MTDECTNEQIETLSSLVEQLKEAGNAALQKGLHSEALKLYSQAIDSARPIRQKCSKVFGQLLNNRSQVNIAMSKWEDALRDARAAIEVDSKNVKAYWRAGRACMKMLRHGDAAACFRRALQLDPTLDDARILLNECERILNPASAKVHVYTKQDLETAEREVRDLMQKAQTLKSQAQSLETSVLSAKNTMVIMAKHAGADITEIPADALAYEQLGRTFTKSSFGAVCSRLSTDVVQIEKSQLPKVKESLNEVMARLRDSEKHLSEIQDNVRRSQLVNQ